MFELISQNEFPFFVSGSRTVSDQKFSIALESDRSISVRPLTVLLTIISGHSESIAGLVCTHRSYIPVDYC